MIYLSIIISLVAASLLLLSAIAFLKAKDVFVMSHIVMIANCYIVPLLLIGIELGKFSWLSFVKILALILLNILIANLLNYAIIKHAMENKIAPDAKNS